MTSSPSAQIVNAVADSHLITTSGGGVGVPAYGPTMAVATAIIALGIAFTVSIGPEKRGSHFESAVVGQQGMVEAAVVKNEDLEAGERARSVGSDEHKEEEEQKK